MDAASLDRQLSDFVYVFAMALRAGYSVRQILGTLSDRAPEPTASVCRACLADLEAGLTYDQAFANTCKTWPSAHLVQILETMTQHQQTGGNLADQLDPLSERIYQAVGSDGAFYPEMRDLANAVGGPLPKRVQQD
jgi:Flp pilus assembly protein TadB